MLNGLLACADCGFFGKGSDAVLLDPPDGNFVGENEAMKPVLTKNKMTYVGCPECKSPNVYFSRQSQQMLTNHFPANEVPQPSALKIKKLTSRVISESPSIGGGKNVVIATEAEMDDESLPDDVDDLADDIFSSLDEEVIGEQKEVEIDEPSLSKMQVVKLKSGEKREIDPSKTATGKERKHVPRPIFRRQCKGCRSKFETKHTDMLICSDCAQGYTNH